MNDVIFDHLFALSLTNDFILTKPPANFIAPVYVHHAGTPKGGARGAEVNL